MIIQSGMLFLALLAWGCFALLPIVKLQEIGQGFYRFFAFFGAIVTGFALGGAFYVGPSLSPAWRSSIPFWFCFGFLCLVYGFALKARSLRLLAALYAAAVTVGFWGVCRLPFSDGPSGYLLTIRLATSGLTMGAGVMAMMLGHWYLVTPRLSIGPLKRLSALYILLTILTTLEVIGSIGWFVGFDLLRPATNAGALLANEFIFAIFRVVWGLLAPLGMGFWIWNTVKIRSTQSATGILYAAMTATLIGEAIGIFLTLSTGVPF